MSEKQGWGNICERVDTCALTGAGAFFAAIDKSEVLINGPLWCYFYALRHLEKARPDMYTRFYGSQPDNNAVIYGSEEYVTQELRRMLEDGHKPSVLLLESSCSLSLIGDDLAGMARKLQLPFPVVTLDSGGMVGGFAEGYAKAAKKLFAQLLPQTATAKSLAVNILGQSEFYLQGAADTRELKRLLQLAGYEVLCTPGCECTLEELQRLPEAALNIVTNAELGLPLAEYLQKQYGTPYIFAGLPYGVQGTLLWLQQINAQLPAPAMDKVTAEAQAQDNYLMSRNNEAIALWGSMWFDNVLVSAPATQALCLAQTLRTEWTDIGRLTVICQQPLKDAPACDTAEAIYTVGVDDAAISEYFKTCENVLLLASSSESSVLYRRKQCSFDACNICYPTNDEVFITKQPMVGLQGSAYMLERLWNCFIRRKKNKVE